jgi:uncharacterized protein with NAD-binding domain and iron-sulfur cluster
LEDDVLVARARSELRGAIPPGSDLAWRHASVVRERHATFSLRPGQPPRPHMETPVSGLWVAGDWTDTGLPATIEGAASSGHRVASALLRGRAA